MRSHIRLSLIVAVAISAFPSSAFADDAKDKKEEAQQEEVSKDVSKDASTKKTSKGHFLNLADARKAFGDSFGPARDGQSVFIYGQSSSACLDGKDAPLKATLDGATGIAKIWFDGSNDDCLDFEKAKASRKDGEALVSIKDATATKMTGDFPSLRLLSKTESDREPNHYDDLLGDDNQPIANESDAKKKEKEKDLNDQRSDLLAQYYESVLEKCINQGGAKALDQSEKALAALSKIAGYLKTKDKGWSEEQMAAINKRRYDAAYAIITHGREADFATATDLLDKVTKSDSSYEEKAAKLYAQAVKRLAASGSGDPSEVVAQGEDILEKLREKADGDEDDAKIAALDKMLNVGQLNRASQFSADSDEFTAMSQKFGEFMGRADQDSGCLVDASAKSNLVQDGMPSFDQRRLGDPACLKVAQLTTQYQRALAPALFKKDVASCMDDDQAAVLYGNVGTDQKPIRSQKCMAVFNKLTEMQKAADASTNSGSSTYLQGNSWGTTYTPNDSRNPAGTTSTTSNTNGNTNSSSNYALTQTGANTVNTNANTQSNQNVTNTTQPQQQQQQQVAPANNGVRHTFRN